VRNWPSRISNIIIALVLGLVLVSAGKLIWNNLPGRGGKITIGNNSVQVEIADSSDEQILGLSGRDSLDRNSGMLFVYESPTNPGFWMKDMRFPIDIVWISDNLKVIGINKDIQPNSYPKSYYPPGPVKYVLEVNAGVSGELGWGSGDEVKLSL